MPPLKVEVFAQDDAAAPVILSAKSRAATELEVDYDKDITRLYEAITSEDWDSAVDAVKVNPKEARTWVVRHHEDGSIMWRFLPLHSACARQPPAELVEALLGAYRPAASACDDQGLYPLHYACGNQASSDVIRKLVLTHPGAASHADPAGMLPLHYLAKWGPADKLSLDILLLVNKDVVTAKTEEGKTALDLASEGEYDDKDSVVLTLKSLAGGGDETENREKAVEEEEQWTNFTEYLKSLAGEEVTEKAVAEAMEVVNSPKSARKEAEEEEEEDDEEEEEEEYAAVSHSLPSELDAINQLKYEIAALKSMRSEESVAAAVAHDENSDLKAENATLRKKLKKTSKACDDLLTEKRNKDEFLRYIERKLAEKDFEMISLHKEATKHREANVELTKKCEEISAQAEASDAKFATLSASYKILLEEQEKIAAAVSNRDALFKKATQRRQKKMQELINMEVELTKEAVQDEREGETSILNESLTRQREEMDSIRDIVLASADE